jgi:hypothetical protein
MSRISHVAFGSALLLAVVASPGFAAGPVPSASAMAWGVGAPSPDATTVWVVNEHVGPVKVYAFSEAGRQYLLGRVGQDGFRVFEIPEQVLEEGATLQIKIFPEGVHSSPDPTLLSETAVKSYPLPADPGLEIQVWVQPDLTRTLIGAERPL